MASRRTTISRSRLERQVPGLASAEAIGRASIDEEVAKSSEKILARQGLKSKLEELPQGSGEGPVVERTKAAKGERERKEAPEADVVLGADGIKSAVRRFVAGTDGQEVDPNLKFSNNVCYRDLVEAEAAAAAGVTYDFGERPICFVGEGRHIIVYAIRGGTLVSGTIYTRLVCC